YRHGSDFHYLTGFAEPGAWLVVEADGRTTLVCRPKDIEREIWDGYRLRPGGARRRCGAAAGRARPADGREDRQPALGLDSLRHARAAGAARRLADAH